jgi:hypothetical protein
MAGRSSLIWARGMTGAKALAPAWRACHIAQSRADDKTLSPAERGVALVEAEQAEALYAALVEEVAQTAATDKSPHTHVLIVGVGHYQDDRIPAVTTSIHGAIAFADWTLNRFTHLTRPLGSVAMLLSPPADMGAWTPQEAEGPDGTQTASALGLSPGDDLPLTAATFANIKTAFAAMVGRAAESKDSALLLYFAGHGLWKVFPYALPEDARLPDTSHGIDNFIDLQATLNAMINTRPQTQVFFIDTCQEVLPKVLANLDSAPGEPLWDYTNAGLLEKRDDIIYFGAYPGDAASGKGDAAPFFTQELLRCLECHAASNRVGKRWAITTSSLKEALEAAVIRRSEQESIGLHFSSASPGPSSFASDLCHVTAEPKVLLQVSCRPNDGMRSIWPYVTRDGQTAKRTKPLPGDWVTEVDRGPCLVGADAVPPNTRAGMPEEYTMRPPVEKITIDISDEAADG